MIEYILYKSTNIISKDHFFVKKRKEKRHDNIK